MAWLKIFEKYFPLAPSPIATQSVGGGTERLTDAVAYGDC
jgi:hypothetical protein